MNYPLAMGILRGQRTASRTTNPGAQVAFRFGSAVLLNNEPTARPSYISWTPTKEDMDADDWNVSEPDGTPVPAPRLDRGTGIDSTGPAAASGGTGAGTGWKRA